MEIWQEIVVRSWNDTWAQVVKDNWLDTTINVAVVIAVAWLFAWINPSDAGGEIAHLFATGAILAVAFFAILLVRVFVVTPISLVNESRGKALRLEADIDVLSAPRPSMKNAIYELQARGEALLNPNYGDQSLFEQWKFDYLKWRADVEKTFNEGGYQNWAFGFISKKANGPISYLPGMNREWARLLADMHAKYDDFRGCAERILGDERGVTIPAYVSNG